MSVHEQDPLADLEEVTGFQNLFEIFVAITVGLAAQSMAIKSSLKPPPVAQLATGAAQAASRPTATLYVTPDGQVFEPGAGLPRSMTDADLKAFAAAHKDGLILVQTVRAPDLAEQQAEVLLATMDRLQAHNLSYTLARSTATLSTTALPPSP